MAYGTVNVPGASGPELEAVKTIANNALSKANEALEEAGSAGCVIKITFDPDFVGKTYTITDGNGDTKTGVVPSNRVDSVSVKNCNTTYTVKASVDGVEYSSAITTGAYFGQYAVMLSVFTATIKVTAAAGAVVTATCNGSSYSATAASNGVATVVVKKAGTYTVSGTVSNAASNTASVNVTSGGATYTTTIKFITLTLTSPSGSAITVSKGSTTLSKTSTGSNVFYLPSTGTWSVTITKSGDSASGSVNATAYQNYSLELSFVHIYGASWDGTSTTAWTRTDESAGFTDPVPYMQGVSNYGSPFDTLQPWAGMVKSERTGGTMVAIPKFWYKLTQNGAGMKIQIADKATAGFSVSPAHMDKGDGKGERSVVYVGRYHCHTSDYKSKTGGKPKASITRSAARTAIHNLGTNIWQMDFAMRFTIWLLYIVEFADWNSQAKIGYGCGNSSAAENMGYTDSMPYHTGTTKNARATYGLGTQYRYIEGLWDNVYDWCDGCYNNGNGLNIILNPNSFSDSSGGTSVGTPSNGWPSAFGVKTAGGFPMFIPTAASGSELTYSCDSWNFHTSDPCVYGGGGYYQNTDYGLFYVSYHGASNAYAYIGCRLQELP